MATQQHLQLPMVRPVHKVSKVFKVSKVSKVSKASRVKMDILLLLPFKTASGTLTVLILESQPMVLKVTQVMEFLILLKLQRKVWLTLIQLPILTVCLQHLL